MRLFHTLSHYLPALCMCGASVYFAVHRDDAGFLLLLFLAGAMLPEVLEKNDA